MATKRLQLRLTAYRSRARVVSKSGLCEILSSTFTSISCIPKRAHYSSLECLTRMFSNRTVSLRDFLTHFYYLPHRRAYLTYYTIAYRLNSETTPMYNIEKSVLFIAFIAYSYGTILRIGSTDGKTWSTRQATPAPVLRVASWQLPQYWFSMSYLFFKA